MFFIAKKKQKFIKSSFELKAKVMSEYIHSDISYKALADKYGIRPATIAQWFYKIKKGDLRFIERFSGRVPTHSKKEFDYKERYEILKKFLAFLVAQRVKK